MTTSTLRIEPYLVHANNGSSLYAIAAYDGGDKLMHSEVLTLKNPEERMRLVNTLAKISGGNADEINQMLLALADQHVPGESVDARERFDGSRDHPAKKYLRTDQGNAERFADDHEGDLIYPSGCGWFIYDGTRYVPDDRFAILTEAKKTTLRMLNDAVKLDTEDRERQEAVAHAMRSQKRERINAMIDLSRDRLAVTPGQLDSDPLVLNCANGSLDLRSHTLRPHRRSDLLTKRCNAKYDPSATAPTWERFLERIFRSRLALIGFAQLLAGYFLTGLTTEQIVVLAYGPGGNGKTVFFDALLYVMGDYAAKADRDLLLAMGPHATAHPTNVADLMGRRLVICSETNDGARIDEAKLKDLSGETVVKARRMHKDFFSFTASHKLAMYSNHRPAVRGTDRGIWRRLKLLPFTETIEDHERDRDLTAKLRAEADGILAWCFEGCARWLESGLVVPADVVEATEAYRKEQDSIGAFINECCVTGADHFVAYSADLYAAYQQWCEDAGEQPLSRKRLGTQLSERGLVNDRDTGLGRTIWRGIGLKANAMVRTP